MTKLRLASYGRACVPGAFSISAGVFVLIANHMNRLAVTRNFSGTIMKFSVGGLWFPVVPNPARGQRSSLNMGTTADFFLTLGLVIAGKSISGQQPP